MDRGKFIVLYGSNNLGKSTQLDLLESAWKSLGRHYTRIKYPRYETATGIIINRELRGAWNERLHLKGTELQALYAENRREYEPCLIELLKDGDVIAEDYVGTGLAWGLTKGVERSYLYGINSDLLLPDISILLDGERFGSGIEKGHRFEGAGQEVWEMNRNIHRELGAEFGWEIVEANGAREKVHEEILRVIGEKW